MDGYDKSKNEAETLYCPKCSPISKYYGTYNAVFTIHLLQLFHNFLSPIWTPIINNNYFKVDIPKPYKEKVASYSAGFLHDYINTFIVQVPHIIIVPITSTMSNIAYIQQVGSPLSKI